MLNKKAIIESMAEKSGLTKTDADKALKAFTDVVTEALNKDEKVQLVGFATFETKKRSARNGINPMTGKPLVIPEKKVPSCKMCKTILK